MAALLSIPTKVNTHALTNHAPHSIIRVTLSHVTMTPSSALERLRAVSSFQESCVLIAAAELDLGTRILEHANSVSAADLAASVNLDLRALTILLDSLAGLGYFIKSDDSRYSVAEPFVEFLDSRHAATFIPMLRHQGNCLLRWSQLSRVVMTGTPARREPSVLGEEMDNVSFILAMNAIGRSVAAPMVEQLKKSDVLDVAQKDFRFLDIGGASGTYTLAFLEAIPQAEGTIFDLPVAIKEARKRFAGTSLEYRVSFVEGDFYRNEFPGGFDLAWISAIIHQQGRTESQTLYGKAYRALKPGGRIAVRDFVMDSTRTIPAQGTLFGINMLVGTNNGRVYTFDEIRADLETAGFVNIRLAVPAETMSAVVAAQKPC